MNKPGVRLNFVKIVFLTLAFCLIASAQATRTWVSGTGDDANQCSRTAPCKTFAGAISKTATGGEIDALDPGGFGAVTITKAITIDGTGPTLGLNGISFLVGLNLVVENCTIFNFSQHGIADASTTANGSLY